MFVLQQMQNLGRRFGTSKMHLSPQWLWLLSVLRRWFCCNYLDGNERAGCFTLFVFLVSHDCCVALPHDATGLSAVGDCGIS